MLLKVKTGVVSPKSRFISRGNKEYSAYGAALKYRESPPTAIHYINVVESISILAITVI